MVDALAERWTPEDLPILDQTDTDLQITRSTSTRVADSSHTLHIYTETLCRRDDYKNWSETLDMAFRVELAALIDERETEFTRADYDVAYTIPPEGWVSSQEFRTTDVLDEGAVEVDGRTIGVAIPKIVHEMLTEYAEGTEVTFSALARDGVDRLLGLREE
ncbi:MAG: hypothetical protein ACI9CA_000813 [Natronomonas sp.]|jgi:hypothetical protein